MEQLYIAGRNLKWCSHYEEQFGSFSKAMQRTGRVAQAIKHLLYKCEVLS
jgi:hypothetical protein